jgi:hypothetical protein
MGLRFRVKSQLYSDQEAIKQGILDDCGPSSMAAAVSWVFKYTPGHDFSAAQGVAAKAKATGRVEKQGVSDNGSSLGDLIKTARVLGAEARFAKSWDEVIAAAKAGAAIGVWVQQPVGYPAGLEVSDWHVRWAKWWGPKGGGGKKDPNHIKAGYGHMTAAVWDAEFGWQWACPTRSGKGKEEFGVQISEETLLKLADSKRVSKAHVAPAFKHVIIVSAPKGWVAPKAAAPVIKPVVPAPAAPVAPAICSSCGQTIKK